MGIHTNRLKILVPGLGDILFAAIVIAVIFLGPRMLNIDGDLPKHLTIGKFILHGNAPPLNDIFSHTRYGAPFAPHKWLSGVLFFISFYLFDERGIVLLSGILLATTFTLIYTDTVARNHVYISTLGITVWGAAVSSLHWIARPHLFTMLLLAIWLVWSERLASGKKIPLWYFPALMFLWNNIHGEFIAGFLVTFAFLAGWVWDFVVKRNKKEIEIGKRIGFTLLLSGMVSLLNPVSFRALSTVTSWMGNDYLMARTQETVPPNLFQPDYLVVLSLIVFSVFALVLNWGKFPARHVFILAGFTLLLLFSARNVHIYGVIVPFVLAGAFKGRLNVSWIKRAEALLEKFENKQFFPLWKIVTLLAVFFLMASTALGRIQRFSPTFFPVEAVEWLKQNPQDGEMFNTFDWGGYLSLHLWPDKRVFVDSQGDVYGEAFLREYEQIAVLNPDWQTVLQKYHVDWVIVPGLWPLVVALQNEGWQTVYTDGTATILHRSQQGE
jgi:hypothetical protein